MKPQSILEDRNIKILHKDNRGMTLVEVIISIALLGFLSIMTLLVFSTGVMLAAKSGDNTEVTGTGSRVVEYKLGNSEPASDGTDIFIEGESVGKGNFTTQSATAVVNFNGAGSTVSIPGSIIIVDVNSEMNDTTMINFIPGES